MKPKPLILFARLLVLSGMVSLSAAGERTSPKPMVIEVSDVSLPQRLLDAQPAVEILQLGAGDEVEAFSPGVGQEWIVPMVTDWHPFLEAAYLAFSDHRPLALSPDMIWQLLVQMAAEEVHAAPEKYRGLFADHEHGNRTLEVRRDGFTLGALNNDWPGVFSELEQRIVAKVPDSPARDFAHAFSTSTPTEIAARRVVLLKAASPYYQYQVGTLCGIPRIELYGTVDDWRWIREQVAGLRQFNMKRRVAALMPVLDECLAAAEGKANPAFWKSYYKFASESGSSYVSGWINVFFVEENDKLLDVVLDRKFSWVSPPLKKEKYGAVNLPLGLRTRSFKFKGVVDVDFVWQHFDQTIPMRWRAGFMGVSQDRKSLTLRPVIAWQVLRAKLSSEERMAADYLGNLTKLDWFAMESIRNHLIVDSKTGHIRMASPDDDGMNDSHFWKTALPLMVRLEAVNIGAILTFNEPNEERAICEVMLSSPSIKRVFVPPDLDEKCLRILKERQNWKIEVEKEK